MADKPQEGGAAGGVPPETDPSTSGGGTITFEDLGIPTTDRGMVLTPVGQRRRLKDVTLLEWIFLILSSVSILVVVALTIARLVELINVDKAPTESPTERTEVETDTTFAILLLFNAVYILFYVLNGVFGERANELLIFVAGIFIVLAYCIINYTQAGSTSQAVKLARLILIAVVGPILVVMSLYIAKRYYDSRNLIFRTVGANIELQDMCQYMFLCESLLKFDLQLEISMVILILENGVETIALEEQLVIGLGVAYGAIWVVMGFLSMRFENKTLTWLFFISSPLEPAYIIYKIVIVAQNFNDSSAGTLLDYAIIICAILGLMVRVTVVLCMAKVYSNFGKGLKEKAYGDDTNEETRLIEPSSRGYQASR